MKLFRITTSDISLDLLLKGQLRFLNEHFEVVGVSADSGLLQKVGKREGIRTIQVPLHREISLKADWQCLWQLVRILKSEKPDIIHANTPKGSLLAMIAGKIAHVPHRIYTVTGLRYQGATGFLQWTLKTMERITCLCATRVIPEGNGVLKTLREDHITGKELHVVHYGNISGIDTNYYSNEGYDKKKDDTFRFVFIGRIVKDKGIAELASCMRRLHKEMNENGIRVKLILVGPFEPEQAPLNKEDEVFLRNSECIDYVGYQSDIRPYLAAADALVFPSYREGFPNVVLQAGSMGLPSIVTNINGCNEIIKDGLNGRIIQPRNEQALYNTMKYFVEHPAEVKRMAGNARRMVQEKYEQRDVWQALLEMYRNEILTNEKC
jgi:glycosyltransferase involved in cell wall biosynthesis